MSNEDIYLRVNIDNAINDEYPYITYHDINDLVKKLFNGN